MTWWFMYVHVRNRKWVITPDIHGLTRLNRTCNWEHYNQLSKWYELHIYTKGIFEQAMFDDDAWLLNHYTSIICIGQPPKFCCIIFSQFAVIKTVLAEKSPQHMEVYRRNPCSLWDFPQCEAPKISKLVQITPISMVYGTYNYSTPGAYKPTNILGGPHIVAILEVLIILIKAMEAMGNPADLSSARLRLLWWWHWMVKQTPCW